MHHPNRSTITRCLVPFQKAMSLDRWSIPNSTARMRIENPIFAIFGRSLQPPSIVRAWRPSSLREATLQLCAIVNRRKHRKLDFKLSKEQSPFATSAPTEGLALPSTSLGRCLNLEPNYTWLQGVSSSENLRYQNIALAHRLTMLLSARSRRSL